VEIVFLRGAEADLFAAWVRYEEALPGLGDRFEAEVRAVLLRIAELPESAPIYAGEFRRLLVRRFEHGVFYRIQGTRIVITAVLDLRQDPTAIRRCELNTRARTPGICVKWMY
jgi:plasmid stabilization system protein ParE